MKPWAALVLYFPAATMAAELSFKGLIDVRASHTDGLDSYVNGDNGKFRNDNGAHLSLAQLAFAGELQATEALSLHAVGAAYADGVEDNVGLTEIYAKYRTTPTANGFRQTLRAGVFYPPISLENRAVGWSSSSSLTPSTMNSWIGEEVRLTGLEYSAEWLGKHRQSPVDAKLFGSLFINNDPTAAMLSWHGWTQSSRQTLLQEKLQLPDFPARNGALAGQASASDPFHEEDGRPGYVVGTELKYKRQGLLQLGYYDNRAQPYRQTNGQYGWDTRFVYAGFRWQPDRAWRLQGQIMQGATRMQDPRHQDVVNNDFRSGYLSLSWREKKHQILGRVEEFSVTDNDTTAGDNNSEVGKGVTLSYRYQLDRRTFLFSEYNWIDSKRGARMYQGLSLRQIERQWLLAARYYF